MFKLGRLKVENFKGIGQEVLIDFSDQRAVILDGPNGFGKTTIFDALEVSITGKLNRVETAGIIRDSKVRTGHFLKNDQSRITEIKLELNNSQDESACVIRTIISKNIAGPDTSVKEYKKHIKRYMASNWDAQHWDELSVDMLSKKLGITNLASLYHVQHYISQEETAHFLKGKNESERHKELSHLFGTERQVQERESLNAVKDRLRENLLKLEKDKNETKEILAKFVFAFDDVETASITSPSGKIPSIINVDGLPRNVDVLESIDLALSDLEGVSKNKGAYEDVKHNNLIDRFLAERESELNDLIKFGAVHDFAGIVRLQEAKSKLDVHLEKRSLYLRMQSAIKEEAGAVSNDLIEKLQLIANPLENESSVINELHHLRNQQSEAGKIISTLRTSRAALRDSYLSYHQEEKHKEAACPFCGDVKEEGIEKLLLDFENHELFFKLQASSFDEKINELAILLNNGYVKRVWRRIEVYLKKTSWLVDEKIKEFFDSKKIDEDAFNRMTKIRKWLVDINVFYQEEIDQKLFFLGENYALRKSKIKQKVELLRRHVGDVVFDLDEIKRARLALGIKSDDEMLVLMPSDIEVDRVYISLELRRSQAHEYNKAQKNLNNIELKIGRVTKKYDEVNEAEKIYGKCIKNYEIEVASNIAIPFFIYTSKILQTRPDGTGIFLQTPEEGRQQNPYIRFCSRKNDNHDAWCTMSSGQLAGLVVSFALAMNRLYPSSLEAIFVDDPFQSMDEINMASLMQLLIFEFPRHQFVFSTHEQRISAYASYKFLQGGNMVKKVHMKSLAEFDAASNSVSH